jgi:large subunit ribosomal protein L29
MTFFLKQAEMGNIYSGDVEKTILILSQELVELRIKKITRQAFKPHEFKHKKRQISQLLTLQNLKNKQN